MTRARGNRRPRKDRDDRPGREIPQPFRDIAARLVAQGWRYDNGGGRRGHPRLYPADPAAPGIGVPTSPGDWRAARNFRAQVRRAGGVVP